MRQRYEDDPADKTPAMLALTLIAWKCEEEAEVGRTAIDAHAPVTVPFWAIQALGVAWCLHRLEGMSLERAFGIGRPGQGLRSPFEKAEHQIGVLGLARSGLGSRDEGWRLGGCCRRSRRPLGKEPRHCHASVEEIPKARLPRGREGGE
jgi:hypothetical protein